MFFLLSIYGSQIYKEFLLPFGQNMDYCIPLSADFFQLGKTIWLKIQNVDDQWMIVESQDYEYKLLQDSNEIGNSSENRTSDRKCYELITEEGEKLNVFITGSDDKLQACRKYKLTEQVTIGRGKENDFIIQNENTVSQNHACIQRNKNQTIIKNKSVNGIYVNDQFVKDKYILKFGDRIDIMGVHFTFLGEYLAVEKRRHNSIVQSSCSEIKEQKFSKSPMVQHKKEKENKNIKDETYFFTTGRNEEPLDYSVIEIREPQAPSGETEQSFLLSLLSVILMSFPIMVNSLIMILFGNDSEDRNKLYLYSGLILAGTTMVTGVLGSILQEYMRRKNCRKKELKRIRVYQNYLKQKEEVVREKYEKNKSILYSREQNPENLAAWADGAPLLWRKNREQADYLCCRLGIGTEESYTKIKIPEPDFYKAEDMLWKQLEDLQQKYRYMYNMPLTVDIRKEGQIGILGETEEKRAQIIKVLLTQITANHSYTEVKIGMVYDQNTMETGKKWDFMRWLPHCWSSDRKYRYLASRKEEASELFYHWEKKIKEKKSYYLLFISAIDFLEGESFFRHLKAGKNNCGISVFWIVDSKEKLPGTCKFVIENNEQFQGFYSLMKGTEDRKKIMFDDISGKMMDDYARKLSNRKEKDSFLKKELPSQLTFFDMYQIQQKEKLNVLERWKKNKIYESICVPVGRKSEGTLLCLDVHERHHGPHGLIAGMTGSGKSELLQTYILSLAVNYSPEDVNFFLIDYKGGGMAGLFDGLPHLCGQISNLSGYQVERSLISLRSEIRRRQNLFQACRINHIDVYTKQFRQKRQKMPLSHLFIIIDEFAELKKENPEFMEELISIAQVGRSLGIHLILATQKPGGTVDEKIWSNARFRICLRVQEKQDSLDMLHKPDAAELTQVGRGYFQVGNNEIFELFQSAWSGALDEDPVTEKTDNYVRLVTLSGQQESLMETFAETIDRRTQMEAVKLFLIDIAEKNHYQNAQSLWMDMLPQRLCLDQIKNNQKGKEDSMAITVGLLDDPENQKQSPFVIDIAEAGHVLICGMSVSGKSTCLQTILFALTQSYQPDRLHIYILDFGGGAFQIFENMPQVGNVICEEDDEKTERFFEMLKNQMNRRRRQIQGGDYGQYLKGYKGNMPRILIVIDNFAGFQERTEQKYEKILLRLTKEGEAIGINLIMTCGNPSMAELPTRIGENIKTILCLEMKDIYSYAEAFHVIQVPFLPERGIKGRGLAMIQDRILEFQTALCIDTADDYGRLEKIQKEAGRQAGRWKGARPWVVKVIPDPLLWSDFQKEEKTAERIFLGYNEKTAERLEISVKEVFCFLICGRKQTGRKNCMKIMIETLRREKGKVCIFDTDHTLAMYRTVSDIKCYISSAEEIYHFFENLIPQIEAHKKMWMNEKEKRERINWISEEKEMRGFWKKEDFYYIFITEMQRFLESAYESDYNIAGFLENIWEKGRGYPMFFAGVIDVEETGILDMYPAFQRFCSHGEGVHFGGNLLENNYYDCSGLSYEEQSSRWSPGTGMVFGKGKGSEKVRAPFLKKYDIC